MKSRFIVVNKDSRVIPNNVILNLFQDLFRNLITLFLLSILLFSCTKTSVTFSDDQQKILQDTYNENGSVCVVLEIQVKKSAKRKDTSSSLIGTTSSTEKNLDTIGFYYDKDFSKSGKLLKEIESRPVVTADFIEFAGSTFRLALCAKKDSELPKGFFVNAGKGVSFKVKSFSFSEGVAGFDFSRATPLFAFPANGGRLDRAEIEKRSFNFSGISEVFPALATKTTLLPVLKLKFASGVEAASINYGGDKFRIRVSKKYGEGSTPEEIINLAAAASPFSQFSVPENPEGIVTCLALSQDKKYLNPLEPISADPGLILKWKAKNFRDRDFELFRWDDFPNILFFDTASYAVQDDLFRRLAFFVEKAGYKGKLASDEVLKNQHGYNAHDYSAKSLADFFEKAEDEFFALNPRELKLKEILLSNGIIKRNADGTLSEGAGAVISISQESPMYLRQVFVAHEGWHGLYFTDEEFRNVTAALYYTVDRGTIGFLKAYFHATPTLNYDIRDEDLMKNEFMAYMLQRPVSQVKDYFLDMAKRDHAQTRIKPEADYIIATDAQGLVSAADLFDQYVFSRWGMSAGLVGRIR